MPVTVCDSSPLIHLAGVGHLDLLQRFYGTVLIPPAVFREVVTEGGTRSPARMVAQAVSEGWIQVASEALPEAANLRQNGKLHAGEAEAIALLQARQSDGVLVMDEAYGRSEARPCRDRDSRHSASSEARGVGCIVEGGTRSFAPRKRLLPARRVGPADPRTGGRNDAWVNRDATDGARLRHASPVPLDPYMAKIDCIDRLPRSRTWRFGHVRLIIGPQT